MSTRFSISKAVVGCLLALGFMHAIAAAATLQFNVMNSQYARPGTVSPSAGSHEYNINDSVTLTAQALTGYTFHWECSSPTPQGAAIHNSRSPSITLTMDQNYTVTLVFEQAFYSFTLVSPVTGGTASIVPPVPIDLSHVPAPTTITVEAFPAAGYSFVRWLPTPADEQISEAATNKAASIYLTRNVTLTPEFAATTYLLTVDTNPSGIGGTATGGGFYAPSSAPVAITASPNAGFVFDKWTVASGAATISNPNSANTGVVLGSAAPWRIVANFKVADAAATTLTVSTDEGGIVMATPPFEVPALVTSTCSVLLPVASGASVSIVASAIDMGRHAFSRWEGDVGSINNPMSANTSVVVTAATSVRARFTPRPYNFTVLAAPAPGASDIGSSMLQAVCSGTTASTTPGPNKRSFPYSTPVVLTATPAPGYAFIKWQSTNLSAGDTTALQDQHPSTGVVTANVTMPAAAPVVTAMFQKLPDTYRLTLNVETGGGAYASGTFINLLTGLSSTVSFPAPGNGDYQEGTTVTLVATPSPNYTFSQWTGDNVTVATSATTTVLMNSSKTVTATFVRARSNLNIIIDPSNAAGSVLDNATSAAPAATHPVSATVNLRAVPAAGWGLDHWEIDGVDAGSANPLPVSMSVDHTVKAVFASTHSLAISISPAGSGTATGAGNYITGYPAYITASAVNGYIFSHWSGDITGIAPDANTRAAVLTMNSDRNITASFIAGKQVTITARSDTGGAFAPNSADGAAIKANGAFHAGATELTSINHPAGGGASSAYAAPGDTITLAAPSTSSTDGGKWVFVRWENAAAPGVALSSSITVSNDMTLCAVYSDSRRLTVNVTLDNAPDGTIGVTVDGSTKHDGDIVTATCNDSIPVSAPALGYVFAGWEGVDGGSTLASSATVTLTSNKTTKAKYKTKRSLTVGLDTIPSGGATSLWPGSVTVRNDTTSANLTLGANPTTLTIGQGDSVTLAASGSATVGAVTYKFAGWDLNDNGQIDGGEPTSTSYSVIMNADATAKALYKREYTLNVSVNNVLYGSATPAGLPKYGAGDNATINATANFGYVFDKWTTSSGAVFASGTGVAANSVAMNADHTVIAHFKASSNALTARIVVNGESSRPVPSSLTVTASGGESVSKVLSDGQSENYYYGDTASIIATITDGYRFIRWDSMPGAVAPGAMANPATIAITGPQQVTANYTSLHTLKLETQTLAATAMTGGTPAATGYESTSGGEYIYVYGATAELRANPEPGFRFVRWEIDLSGDGVADLTPSGAANQNYNLSIVGNTLARYPDKITAKAVYAKEYSLTMAVDNPAGGTSTPVSGTVTTCYYDEVVPISASPSNGWHFVNWTSDSASILTNPNSQAGATVKIQGDTTVTAHFSADGVTLTARVNLDGATSAKPELAITADGTPLADSGTKGYLHGETATLIPATGMANYIFTGWSTALSGTANPATLIMNGSKTVTANYSSIRKLTVSTETRPGSEAPGGAATAGGAFQTNPPDYFYRHGDTATLTATPNAGFAFLGWSIDGGSVLSTGTTVAMSADHTASAVFAKQYPLTLASNPTDGGAAATNPGSPNPSTRYFGEVVSLRATPAAGYAFASWTTSDPSSPVTYAADGTGTITIGGAATATANFTANPTNLTINIVVDGMLKPVTFTDLNVTANGSPRYSTQQYNAHCGDTIALVASAASGYKFSNWTGGVTTGSPVTSGTVTMGATGKTVVANYVSLHTVTVLAETRPGGTGGSTTVAPGYESGGGTQYVYTHGANASVTAYPESGYVFAGWDTDNDGIVDLPGASYTTYNFEVNADITIKAIFAQTYTITFATTPADGSGGTITPARGTSQTYYHGQVISLGATPNVGSGYSFQSWTATGGSTFADFLSDATDLTVLGDGVVTGHFSLAGSERNLTILIKVDGVLVAVAHELTVSADGSAVPGFTTATALHSTESKPYYPVNTASLDAAVSAALSSQYAFYAWEDLSGAAAISPTRNVAMSAGSKTITALYKSRVTLVMATNPFGVGITTPSVGPHTDVLRGDSVSITADLQGAQLDNYVFRNWTVDTGSAPISPNTSITSVLMDPVGNTKTVTANFDPGYRLDVVVKYETSATPDTSPKTYAEAAGSRSSLANGAGNTAGLYNELINSCNHSVETIVQNGTATVRAAAAAGYTFVGWEFNGAIVSTSTTYTHTMTAPATLKAVFEKIRVKLEVYTNPSGNPDLIGQSNNGLLVSAVGAEPKVYQFFWGETANLHAENNDTAHYNFSGWRKGIGMGELLSGSFDYNYGPLTQSVTQVTALFLPKSGDYLLYIYTTPDAKSRPSPETHPLITAVNVPGCSGTHTVDETGRPVYIVAVPSGTINIHADGSSGGWGFHHWEPISECNVNSFGNRSFNDTTFSKSVAQNLNPLPVVKILAVYADIPGYLLSLRAVFDDHVADPTIRTDYIVGMIAGDSMDSNMPWLFVAALRLYDAHIFEANHVETFTANPSFINSPLSISGWDYDVGGVRKQTMVPGNSFTTQPSTAGVNEVVTVHIALDWKTVSLRPTEFEQPTGTGWIVPATGFVPHGLFSVESSNIYDSYFSYRIINPPPSPFKWQGKRVRGSTSPTIIVGNSDPANYRFKQWNTSVGGVAGVGTTQSLAWANAAAWPKALHEDREATPVFIRLMPMTLAIVHAGGAMSTDNAMVPVPAGDPNNHGILVTPTLNDPDPATLKYDYMRALQVIATPQASEYHIVKEFIIEKDTDNDGVYETRTTVPGDNSTSIKTLDVTLNYPTKVTVVFDMQQSQLTVDVANSVDGAPHGKIQLNNLPAAGALSRSGTFGYGTLQDITALPDANYTFKGWTVSPTNLANANPINATNAKVMVDFPKTVSAHFERNVTLILATNPGSLPPAIITPNAGIYTELPVGTRLTDGSQVSIQASGDAGWDFVQWEIIDDDNPSSGSPRVIASPSATLTLHGDTTATAKYAKLYNVTIHSAPAPTLAIDSNRVVITQTPVNGGPMNAASNGIATRNGDYRENTALTITATPSAHYDFDHWELSIGGVAQPNITGTTLSIAALADNMEIRGVFTPKNYTITVAPWSSDPRTPIAATLNGTASLGGTPAAHDFLGGGTTWVIPYGTSVTLSTTAADYYQFTKWTDAGHSVSYGTDASNYTFTVSGDAVIHAQFTRNRYLLTTAIDPAGKGTINSVPPRGANPSVHAVNENVTLTAAYNSDTDFDGWTGDTGTADTTLASLPLTMNQDRSVTARFVDIVRLKVVNPNPAFGSVAVTGARRTETDGSGNTIYVFKVGTNATITATPNGSSRYQFDNWTFDPAAPAGVSNPALAMQTFTMTATPAVLTVTANFSPKPYTLTVQYNSADPAPVPASPIATALDGTGIFLGSPHNFLVPPGSSTVSLLYNTSITLTTTPGPYYKLLRWTNAAGSADYGNSAYTFNMPDADTTVVAKFARSLYKLTAHINPSGGGSINASPLGGVDPGSNADTTVYTATNPGTNVTLTASDAAGKIFTGWTGPDAGGASGRNLTFAMDRDREVTANFATAYTLTVRDDPLGSVTVTGHSPYATVVTNGDGSKTYTFAAGTTANVTATPGTAHYEFSSWTFTPTTPAGVTLPGLANPSISFAMDGSYILTPAYVPKKYDITVVPYSADPAPVTSDPAKAVLATQLQATWTGSSNNFLTTPTVAIDYNTVVALAQTPGPYYAFLKWTDTTHTATYSSPFTVGVSDGLTNRTIVAQYVRSLYRLRAHVETPGAGTISAVPPGGADPDAAPETTVYAPNTAVTLTASDAAGKIFTHWSGPDSAGASGRNLSVRMDRDRDVTANFANAWKLTIPETAHGSVTVSGYSQYSTVTINGDGSKTYVFAEGATAVVTGTPESQHYFIDRWDFTPDISGSVTPNPIAPDTRTVRFAMTQDVTVAPHFQPKTYTLTVTPVPAAGALTLIAQQLGNPDHDFLVTPSLARLYPTQVTLVTEPKDVSGARYRFVSWVEGIATLGTSLTQAFTYDHDASITANYVRQILITIGAPQDITPANSAPFATCGTVTPGAGVHRYDITPLAQTVTITATASEGFEFAGWIGNTASAVSNDVTTTATTSAATLTFTINDALANQGDIALTPTFKRRLYTVILERWDKGQGVATGGTVTAMTAPDVGANQYYYGTPFKARMEVLYASYRFIGWGIGADTTASRVVQQPGTGLTPDYYTYSVAADRTISAVFTKVCVITLTTDPSDGSKGTAAITSPTGRPVPLQPAKTEFDYGTQVNLKATAASGCSFIGWAGAVHDPDANSTYIILRSDQSIVARFASTVSRNLTIKTSPAAAGSVSMNGSITDSAGAGTLHPSSYTKQFNNGTTVQLSATPMPGYTFSGWSPPGAVTINNPNVPATTAIMNADKVVTALFTLRNFTLQVYAQPSAGGTVSGGGTYTYNSDGTPKTPTITATPKPGYTFVRWDISGGDIGSVTSNSATVPMTMDRVANAIFHPVGGNHPPKVTVYEIKGSGAEVPNMFGASVDMSGPDAFGDYTILCRPATGFEIAGAGWGGPDIGDAGNYHYDSGTNTYSISIPSDQERKIYFYVTRNYVTLTWSALPSDGGTVSFEPAGGRYLAGTTVRVIATPAGGNTFFEWGGALSGTNADTTITLTNDATVIAIFQPKPFIWTVTLGFDTSSAASPNPLDTLILDSSSVHAADIPALITKYYPDKTQVPLSYALAAPELGLPQNSTFDCWTNISPSSIQKTAGSNYLLYVNGNLNPRGLFKPINPLLTTELRMGDMTKELEPDEKTDLISIGGAITEGGVVVFGHTYTVRVTLKTGYVISQWVQPAGNSSLSMSSATGTDSEGHKWEERTITVRDLKVEVLVILEEGGADERKRRNTVQGSKNLHDDITTNKSSGHFIDQRSRTE